MAAVDQVGIEMTPAGAGRSAPPALRAAPCGGEGERLDGVLERALRPLDPEVARSFSPEQRRAIRTMLDLRSGTEPLLDLRRGVSLGGRRYFLTLMLGRERRRLSRAKVGGLLGGLRHHARLLLASGCALAAIFAVAAALRG